MDEHWLTANLFLCWGRWDALRRTLEGHRLQRRQKESATFAFGGETFYLVRQPRGMQFPATWYLHHPAFTLALQDRAQASSKAGYPNAQVVFTGDQLPHGADPAWDRFRRTLTAMGGRLLGTQLSRVDVALDLLDVPLAELLEAYERKQYVQTSRTHHRLEGPGGEATMLTVGKGALMLHIYDKLAQLQQDPGRRAWLSKHRWHADPAHVTRVEYQLRRKALTTRGIDSVEGWLRGRAAVVQDCLGWFRLTARRPSRGNEHATPLHPHWAALHDLHARWDPHHRLPSDLDLEPLAGTAMPDGQRLATAVTHLLSISAGRGMGAGTPPAARPDGEVTSPCSTGFPWRPFSC